MTDTTEQAAVERKALWVSIVGYLLLGTLAVIFALYSQSEAIMLDGFFNLVSLVMSVVTLYVARLLLRPMGPRHQYGYALFEPFVNTIKGLLLFAVSAIALISAVDSLIDGGRPLSAGPALMYSLIATVGCILVFTILRVMGRGTNSPLLELDLMSWRMSGWISSAVALGFGGAVVLGRTGHEDLVPYVDPLLVVILVIVMIRMPILTIKESVSDLLLGAPPEPLQEELGQRVEPIVAAAQPRRTAIRMAKVGRNVFVTVFVIVEPSEDGQVGDHDRLREQVADAVADVQPNIIVDLIFTGDERWAT